MSTSLPTNMDPLDDVEDPENLEDDAEADAAFSANLVGHVAANLAPDVHGMVLLDEQVAEVLDGLGGAGAAPDVDSPCPKCGKEMEAEVDPASLLSFPMKYVWRCLCGHTEAREDKHVLENPGADASMVGTEGDDIF